MANWSAASTQWRMGSTYCATTKEEALALKYLGIHNIFNNTSTTQLNLLSTDTQRVARRIATRTASSAVKIRVYNSFFFSRIGNYAGENEG